MQSKTRKKCFNVIILVSSVFLCIMMINYFESMFNPNYIIIEHEQIIPRLEDKENRKMKHILLWNSYFSDADWTFGFGNKPFHDHKCSITECYITNNRSFVAIDSFDAVMFHGPEYMFPRADDRPSARSRYQRYVYFSYESPANRPVSQDLNGFFNMTATYRFDSDIFAPYFNLYDNNGTIVAPAMSPNWKEPVLNPQILDQKYMPVYNSKKKSVAWFVSNCHSKNKRENVIKQLQNYISVDVYGSCGTFKCPRKPNTVVTSDTCNEMLKDYFFYLAYENSNCIDYVSEKPLMALQHLSVPIVYGGADYTKFLPPHSYIDAFAMSTQDLVEKMKHLMNNPQEYIEYFWWKDYYHHTVYPNFFCKVCEILHTQNLEPQTINIHDWWHGTSANPTCFS